MYSVNSERAMFRAIRQNHDRIAQEKSSRTKELRESYTLHTDTIATNILADMSKFREDLQMAVTEYKNNLGFGRGAGRERAEKLKRNLDTKPEILFSLIRETIIEGNEEKDSLKPLISKVVKEFCKNVAKYDENVKSLAIEYDYYATHEFFITAVLDKIELKLNFLKKTSTIELCNFPTKTAGPTLKN